MFSTEMVCLLNFFTQSFKQHGSINGSISPGQYIHIFIPFWMEFSRRSSEDSQTLMTFLLTKWLVRLIQLFERSSHRQSEHNSQIIETSPIFSFFKSVSRQSCLPATVTLLMCTLKSEGCLLNSTARWILSVSSNIASKGQKSTSLGEALPPLLTSSNNYLWGIFLFFSTSRLDSWK